METGHHERGHMIKITVVTSPDHVLMLETGGGLHQERMIAWRHRMANPAMKRRMET